MAGSRPMTYELSETPEAERKERRCPALPLA